jgi:hypothetical protein
MANSLFPVGGAVKALRAYHKERLSEIDFDDLLLRLHKETDRAKIILLSTILEDLLEYHIASCIKVKLTPPQTEYVFRLDGPLATFSSRIELAYVFGFVEPEIARQLNVIREMRNACAHSKYELSFDHGVLSNVAKAMFKPIGLFAPHSQSSADVRHTFLAEMKPLFFTLIYGSRQAAIDYLRKQPGGTELFPTG